MEGGATEGTSHTGASHHLVNRPDKNTSPSQSAYWKLCRMQERGVVIDGKARRLLKNAFTFVEICKLQKEAYAEETIRKIEAWKEKWNFGNHYAFSFDMEDFDEIMEILIVFHGVEHADNMMMAKKSEEAGIIGQDAELFKIKELFSRGQATIITGINEAGKSNLAAWIVKELINETVHENRPLVLTNLSLKPEIYKELRWDDALYSIITVSDIFRRIAMVDSSGEPRDVFVIIDEYDGIEGGNAWTTRSKSAGLSFHFYNQMRKLQGVRFVMILHFHEDINVRYRGGTGVNCFIHKGQYYPVVNKKKVEDCLRIHDKSLRRRTAAIWWAGECRNMIEIPNMEKYYDHEKFAHFEFDMDPAPLIKAVFKAGQENPGKSGIPWYKIRGGVIDDYLDAWEQDKEQIERKNVATLESKEFVEDFVAEGSELQETGKMTHPAAYEYLKNKYADEPFIKAIPSFRGYETAVRRYRDGGMK